MDMSGVIAAALVALVVIVVAVAAFIWVGLQKGLGRLTAITIGLLLLSIIISLDNRLRLAAALAATATAIYLLLAPSRPNSPFRRDTNRFSTIALAAVSLGGILLFAWVFTSHMWDDVMLTVAYTQHAVELDGNTVALEILVDQNDLGDSVRIDEVRNRGAGILVPDATVDLDCRTCQSRYRLVIYDESQDGWSVVVEARVEVPRIFADRESTTAIDFIVTPLDIQPTQIDFGTQLRTTLEADRPFTLLRGAMAVPAAAMTSDGLNSWPAFWRMDHEILVGDPSGGRSAFHFVEIPGPHDCLANEPCRDSEVVAAIAPRLLEGTTPVEAVITGSVDYLDAAILPGDTSIEFSLDEASSWAVEYASGTIEQEAEGFEVDLILDLPVSGIPGDYGVVAWTSWQRPDTQETSPAPVMARCSNGSCTARFYIGDTSAGPVEWSAEFHIGFFDDQVPAGFVAGELTSRAHVYQIDDDH